MENPGVYNPPANAFYTQIVLPAYITPAIFIGRDGCYFKKITEQSQSQYIWYDDVRGVIEVWGPEWSLQPALRRLRQRMEKFQNSKVLYTWYTSGGNPVEFEKN